MIAFRSANACQCQSREQAHCIATVSLMQLKWSHHCSREAVCVSSAHRRTTLWTDSRSALSVCLSSNFVVFTEDSHTTAMQRRSLTENDVFPGMERWWEAAPHLQQQQLQAAPPAGRLPSRTPANSPLAARQQKPGESAAVQNRAAELSGSRAGFGALAACPLTGRPAAALPRSRRPQQQQEPALPDGAHVGRTLAFGPHHRLQRRGHAAQHPAAPHRPRRLLPLLRR